MTNMYPEVDLENAHVLIIEDQASIRDLVRKALKKSGHFLRFTEAQDVPRK